MQVSPIYQNMYPGPAHTSTLFDEHVVDVGRVAHRRPSGVLVAMGDLVPTRGVSE